MFGNYFEYNYRSGISKTIEGDIVELMEDNRSEKYCAEIHSLFIIFTCLAIELIKQTL